MLSQLHSSNTRSRGWSEEAESLLAPENEPLKATESAPDVAIAATTEVAIAATARVMPKHAGRRDSSSGQRLEVAPAGASASRSPAGWRWGLLGFASGVIFWHLIGFWGFVAEVVLPTPSENRPFKASANAAPAQPALTLPLRPARPRHERVTTASTASANAIAKEAAIPNH